MTDPSRDNLSPIPCNQGVLSELAALAQQVDSPVEPYPIFFSNAQCGGALSGSSFPSFFLPANCDSNIPVPHPIDNCLRVLSLKDIDPKTTYLTGSQINYLRNTKLNIESSIFSEIDALLFSFYIPPHYTVIFFKEDPTGSPKKTLETLMNSETSLKLSNNYLAVNLCRSKLTMGDGSFFLSNADYDATTQCVTPSKTDLGLPFETDARNLSHMAPWFVLIKNEEFSDLLIDMCVKNREVFIGDNNLKSVWGPQTTGCDKLMNTLCNMTNVSSTKYKETCSCYTQQSKLNREFGKDLKVPVCCFGSDDSGDIDKSCAFNAKSYKTAAMLKNCCSFAECSVASTQISEQSFTKSTGVTCHGTFVDFPKKKASSTHDNDNPDEDRITKKDYSIPSWVIIMNVISAVFILLFLIGLSFL